MKLLLLFLAASAAIPPDHGLKHLVCRSGKKVVYSVYGDIRTTKTGWVLYDGDKTVVIAVSKPSKFKCGIEK